MPKEYFQLSNTTSLADVPAGGRIHVIGVAGVAMGQLAVALANLGYRVTGSDKRFYEPMGSFLKSSPVELFEGYRHENITGDVDLVVIGNAVSYGHEEVAVVEERNLPYTCFPKVLFETAVEGRTSIVACGTHGKSTTTALLASALSRLEAKPSYFIGGVCLDLPSSLHIGSGPFSVVEGDEYDSAFFAKVPKFSFYRPDTCIINAIEFDHADIYPDLDAVVAEFRKLLLGLSDTAVAICCTDFPEVAKLVNSHRDDAPCRVVTFGTELECDYRIQRRTTSGAGQDVSVVSSNFGSFAFQTPLIGEYNARNVLATVAALLENGIELKSVLSLVPTLQGVKRRQEVRATGEQLLIEDFAHHPTAVQATIAAVKERYPGRRILAMFEPRSAASRRKVFQSDYVLAFSKADAAVISAIEEISYDQGHALLDIGQLSEEITRAGTPCQALPGAETIAEHALRWAQPDDILLVMSNGSFGGLIDILADHINRKGSGGTISE